MKGYPSGEFGPNRAITRAEVIALFSRLVKEKPEDAIKQAIAYATFIDYILRDKNDEKAVVTSENWQKIFNIKTMKRKKTLFAVINTPIGKYNEKDFANTELVFPSGDKLKLHYIYFDKSELENGTLTKKDIISSL